MKKLLTCIALGFATTSYAVTPLWMRDVQMMEQRSHFVTKEISIKYRPKEEQRHNLPPKHRMNARQSGLRTENKSLSPAIVTAISIYS